MPAPTPPKATTTARYAEGHRIHDASSGQQVVLVPQPGGRAHLTVKASHATPPALASLDATALRELGTACVDLADALAAPKG